MTADKDIRWEQRFSNYRKALIKLTEAISFIKHKSDMGNKNPNESALNEIIKEGLIQRFEYTYELAWNVMKDYSFYQGNTEIDGSRDAIRYAFSTNLINDGDLWMDMIKSRIKTAHTYNEETANEIVEKIIFHYFIAFKEFEALMESKRSGIQLNLFGK